MNMYKFRSQWIGSIVAVTLVLLSLWFPYRLSLSRAPTVEAAAIGATHAKKKPNAPLATLTVCPSGPPTCDYGFIQEAVDAAGSNDLIKVASGTYNDLHARAAPPGYDGPSVITQVVFLTKSITLRGGYDTSFVDPPDPIANPTTLDALGQARALYIWGDIATTLEGLRFTGGYANDLGGGPWGNDVGGGIYIFSATVMMENCDVFSNTTSSQGGGVYLIGGDANFGENTFFSNQANYGGGVYVASANADFEGNTFHGNRSFSGGGLNLFGSTSVLQRNLFSANVANGQGGGIYISAGPTTFEQNTLISNTANLGGAALLLENPSTWASNVVAGNRAQSSGSAFYIRGATPIFKHSTIAGNIGGDGSGLYVTDSGGTSSRVAMTNTILVKHGVGISITAGNTTTLRTTLWGSGEWANGADWLGDGTIITHPANLWADPAFVDPGSWDYHLTRDSAALHTGVNVGVFTDIDDQPRPLGPGYDIGADEFAHDIEVGKKADKSWVTPGEQLTFYLYVTNTGYLPLTANITDVLPAHVTPGGEMTWPGQVIAAGSTWEQTVIVTVDSGYSGPLVNLLEAEAEEGPAGSDTVTVVVAVERHFIFLPLIRK